MKTFLFKGALAILLPMIIHLALILYNFIVSYSELQAKVTSHIEIDGKKDASIENKLQSIDNKLDILLLSRSQLNKKLERIINDNGNK